MKISQSLIPEVVFYKEFSDCTIQEALLYSLQHAKNQTLTLPEIWRIKVNWNKLLWSYWKAIERLRKEGYQIENVVYHDVKKHITRSTYILKNKDFSPSDSEQFNNI